jgi:hypothetical protein
MKDKVIPPDDGHNDNEVWTDDQQKKTTTWYVHEISFVLCTLTHVQ